ncbi:MAG: hypothetical protein U9N48_02730 [Euryarchaeota archaeon]|nr:hypothetical protein [Euryarchaeota archaeon]
MVQVNDLDLANALRNERRTADLQPLAGDFYRQVGSYLTNLGDDLSGIEDNFSVEAQLIEEEYKSARRSINRLIDLRMKKIARKVQRASSASKDVTFEGMTPEEEQIYRQMLAALIRGRESILAQINPSRTERPLTGKKDVVQEYTVVRLTDSVPTFIGVNGRRYTLQKDDLVMLPAVHATNLCNKNLAREVK